LNRHANDKINYLYGRLSNEDERLGDSMSIENQRLILTTYAEDNGFSPFVFVYDDGISGVDWDRPGINKILEDVEAGRVKTLITKDAYVKLRINIFKVFLEVFTGSAQHSLLTFVT